MNQRTLETILDLLVEAGRLDLADTLLEMLDRAGMLPPLDEPVLAAAG